MLVLGASFVVLLMFTAGEPGNTKDTTETKAVVQTEEPLESIEQLQARLESRVEYEGLLKKARDLKGQSRYPEAAQQLVAALKLEPESPKLWSELGGLFYLNKEYGEARDAFRKALTFDANYLDATRGMAWTSYTELDLEEARRWFLKHPELQSSVVHTDLLLGNYEEAAELSASLLESLPEDSNQREFYTQLHAAAVAREIPDDLRKKIEPAGWQDWMAEAEAPDGGAAANLLANGGFEKETDGWIIGSNSGRMTLTPDKDVKTEGEQSLRIAKTGGMPIDIVRINCDGLTPGQKVTVSARIKAQDVGNAWMKFYVWDAEGNVLIEDLDVARIHGTYDWRTAKKRFTVPEGTTKAAIQFWMILDGTIWIDDVRIEPVD